MRDTVGVGSSDDKSGEQTQRSDEKAGGFHDGDKERFLVLWDSGRCSRMEWQ